MIARYRFSFSVSSVKHFRYPTTHVLKTKNERREGIRRSGGKRKQNGLEGKVLKRNKGRKDGCGLVHLQILIHVVHPYRLVCVTRTATHIKCRLQGGFVCLLSNSGTRTKAVHIHER